MSARPPKYELPLSLKRPSSSNRAHEDARGFSLALAARSSGSSRRSSEVAEETVGPDFNLRKGEQLDKDGIDGKPVYIIRNAAGAPVGVRKIATSLDERKGQFSATQNEATVYRNLVTIHGWRDHILPIRSEHVTDDLVVLDFDWVEGNDLKTYLAEHPSEMIPVLRQAILQLRWFTLHGYSHGDVRLDNFYRKTDGTVLLFDFGRTRRVNFMDGMKDVMTLAPLVQPFNTQIASWLTHEAMTDPPDRPVKERIADIYLRVVSALRQKSSSNSSRRNSNARRSNRTRKSRKSSSN